MRFEYLEIRPCVEHDGETRSFTGTPEFVATIGDEVDTPEAAEAEAEAFRLAQNGEASAVFWTLYGRDEAGLAVAIGDFSTWAAADEVMNAILAPMAAARDAIRDGDDGRSDAERAADNLDDFINQCSNSDRI